MNLTQDLEEFHSELEKARRHLQKAKDNYPRLFLSVLPEGEEMRLGDALQALSKAQSAAEDALLAAGSGLEID